jgi:hypothetical protein
MPSETDNKLPTPTVTDIKVPAPAIDVVEESRKRSEKLRLLHRQAIEMKYDGLTYVEIEKALQIGKGTAGWWFQHDGPLRQQYLEYEAEQNQIRRDMAMNALRRSFDKSMKVLVKLLESDDEKIRIQAIKEINDRILGKPIQPILNGEAGHDVIQRMKKELGIDEQSLSGVREMDVERLPAQTLPVSEGDNLPGDQSDSD